MKNDESKIWVTISETINTGEYESVKIEAGYSKSYGVIDDPEELLKSEIDNLRKIVKKKAKKIKKEKKS